MERDMTRVSCFVYSQVPTNRLAKGWGMARAHRGHGTPPPPLSIEDTDRPILTSVDVAAASARGIQVSHTPAAVDDATATVGTYLAISALRQFYRAEQNVRSGKWKAGLNPARDPEGRTVGIIGMGGIGSALARRLLAFDMKIIYHNRNPISPAPSFPCEYVADVDDLLARADVISLNLPLNDKTKGSFGKAQFDKMKDGSVLINTARGAVVDEKAFIEALESGKLYAAGIDVYPDEPNVNPRLLEFDNITLLPHMGTETQDTQKKVSLTRRGSEARGLAPRLPISGCMSSELYSPQMELLVFDNIISAVSGKGLLNQVPEQKK